MSSYYLSDVPLYYLSDIPSDESSVSKMVSGHAFITTAINDFIKMIIGFGGWSVRHCIERVHMS